MGRKSKRRTPRVEALVPDAGLIIAVQRYSGGAVLHVLLQLLDRYIFACDGGRRELADELKIAIYRKMRDGRMTEPEKRQLEEAERIM